MVSRVTTVAFQGVDARPVDVQVHITPGLVGFSIVGLPDKAVAESRERVRSALVASGMAMPAKRITVNLAPADLPKEGHRFGYNFKGLALSSFIRTQPVWKTKVPDQPLGD
jgi:magnesium chelatase family protein